MSRSQYLGAYHKMGGRFLALEDMKQPLLQGSLLLGCHGVNVFTITETDNRECVAH